MKQENQPISANRRDFLKFASVGAAAGAAVAVAGGGEAVAAVAAPQDDKQTGYRMTDHIKAVYQTSRY
ncbi:MAG: formate dehydrogenase [Alphaproteobacteria bacterium]|nr:formate dehydrogenase [Alphaproteobacteria bacterium]MBU0799028.1 formate dehydrogenase [Alphaproteobacteria bacterium]MBU0889258.1 formate dehydrogenase [Alphaproteobacteria bacterium]MBU1815074.1 formate dehydrogenase [Alphaproteobacteria bacterium]MBU2091136.1 formate dehydrogenase [Alphaproteobacteria bacterium]